MLSTYFTIKNMTVLKYFKVGTIGNPNSKITICNRNSLKKGVSSSIKKTEINLNC